MFSCLLEVTPLGNEVDNNKDSGPLTKQVLKPNKIEGPMPMGKLNKRKAQIT